MSSDRYCLVLTEDGYTTADGPMPKVEALAEFERFSPNTSPHSGTRLRVMSETEYHRSKPTRGNA